MVHPKSGCVNPWGEGSFPIPMAASIGARGCHRATGSARDGCGPALDRADVPAGACLAGRRPIAQPLVTRGSSLKGTEMIWSPLASFFTLKHSVRTLGLHFFSLITGSPSVFW